MTPAAIIRKAQADGVKLTLSTPRTIKATGDGAAVNRWLNVIREHKSEIIDALKGGANDTSPAYRHWLIHNPDRDPLEVLCTPPATHAEILEWYPDATVEPFTLAIRQTSASLTAEEETAIRAWLALIEETNPVTIAEVIGQCQREADARDYFTGRAVAELPKHAPFSDDRRTCNQCVNLIAQRCQAAKQGEIVRSRNYEPIHDLPRRCEGYAPGADDPDKRHGRKRWPGLIKKGVE